MARKVDARRRRQLKRDAARELRINCTEAERKLWACLRNKRLLPLRFRRQQPIGPYIVDFYCSAMKLIVELDGSQHGEVRAVAYDNARTRWLEERGYCVLRIWNGDLMRDGDSALEYIWREVQQRDRPLPEALRASTLPQGEG